VLTNHKKEKQLVNTVNLYGHLASDPRSVSFESGRTLTRLRIAVRRPRTGAAEDTAPDFFDVQAWGAIGRAAAEHLHCGCALALSGKLRQHTQTTDAGERRERVYVVADWIDFPPTTLRISAPAMAGAAPELAAA
jgi:single-stranded DNA-binding protein